MADTSTRSSESKIEVSRAAPADRQRLENLLQLYIHDFSEILGLTPDDSGRFGYPLEPYWTEPGRFPFLIRVDGRLAGFALVATGSQVSGDATIFDLSEFFVVRGVRRHGVGAVAAARLFALFPGTWEVRVLDKNTGAVVFWQHTVGAFTHARFESFMWTSPRAARFHVYRFASPAAPA